MGLPSSEFAKIGEYYFPLSVFSSKLLLCFENVILFLFCLFVSRFSVFTLLSLSVCLFACLFVCVSVCCVSVCVSVCLSVCCQSPTVNICLLFRNVYHFFFFFFFCLSLINSLFKLNSNGLIWFDREVFIFISRPGIHIHE
jgi:hypothetical protein